jgi:hypothetical protein
MSTKVAFKIIVKNLSAKDLRERERQLLHTHAVVDTTSRTFLTSGSLVMMEKLAGKEKRDLYKLSEIQGAQ